MKQLKIINILLSSIIFSNLTLSNSKKNENHIKKRILQDNSSIIITNGKTFNINPILKEIEIKTWPEHENWETAKANCSCLYEKVKGFPSNLQTFFINSRETDRLECKFNEERISTIFSNRRALQGIKEYKRDVYFSLLRLYNYSLAVTGSSLSSAGFTNTVFSREMIDYHINITNHLSQIYKGVVEHFIGFIYDIQNKTNSEICNTSISLYPKEIIWNIKEYLLQSSKQERGMGVYSWKMIEKVRSNPSFFTLNESILNRIGTSQSTSLINVKRFTTTTTNQVSFYVV
jgi:hypothetical protein